MSNEFLLEVFFIKIKIKTNLNNVTTKTNEKNEVNAIKNKDTITYMLDNTKYKLTIKDNQIELIRDNPEFTHEMLFINQKETESVYYIKEYHTTININIKTIHLDIDDKHIRISYNIVDSGEQYDYLIDIE